MGKKQFLNSMYFRGGSKFDKATGKYVFLKNDALIFTVKDVETLQTELKIIPHPTIDFYIAKQHQKFHKMYMPVEELRKVTIPYSERDHAIAQCLNKLPEFTYARRNGSYWEYSKEILKNPDLYFADQNIEDYYKTKYIMDNADEETGDQTVSPRYSMCFSDTEVDISEYNESFPDPSIAPCPINLIFSPFLIPSGILISKVLSFPFTNPLFFNKTANFLSLAQIYNPCYTVHAGELS